MKSFCQAGWLLTICVGNIIDVIVSQSQLIEDQVKNNQEKLALNFEIFCRQQNFFSLLVSLH